MCGDCGSARQMKRLRGAWLPPLQEANHLTKLYVFSSEIYDGVTTEQLDLLSSEISISLYSKNKEYKDLAARIIISNHHKNTDNNYAKRFYLRIE